MIDTKNYKTIIFDLGGVFINLDFERANASFSQLFGVDFKPYYGHAAQSDIFNNFEKGTLSAHEFAEHWRKIFNKPEVTNEQIFDAWNSLLIDWPVKRMNMLKKAREYYRIFLLSNNNIIHEEGCHKLAMQAGNTNLHGLFEKAYLSHEMGMRKPDAEIFERVIDEQNIDLKTTLFIDDSIQHIKGASKTGLQAYHLTGTETITDLFPHLS